MEPQIQHALTQDGFSGEGARMTLEWHAFLAYRKRQLRLVGRVEAVDRDQIRLTRIDLGAGSPEDVEVCVSWDEVDCIAVCGPDRDQDLFGLLHDETHD
jgi:hypothetical protein